MIYPKKRQVQIVLVTTKYSSISGACQQSDHHIAPEVVWPRGSRDCLGAEHAGPTS